MVDRIIHIGTALSGHYNKELLYRAAEVYVYKSPAAVVPHLISLEKIASADAEQLFQKIDVEMRKVNRQVLVQYGVFAAIFMVLVFVGVFSQSYVFAGLFALPALRLLYSTLRFARRNPL